MKQAILNLKKKLFLIELPQGNIEDVEDVAIKLLGKLTDITESQYQQWVKQNDELSVAGFGFEDYNGTSICDTAKESFFSYLEKMSLNNFDFNRTYIFEIL